MALQDKKNKILNLEIFKFFEIITYHFVKLQNEHFDIFIEFFSKHKEHIH